MKAVCFVLACVMCLLSWNALAQADSLMLGGTSQPASQLDQNVNLFVQGIWQLNANTTGFLTCAASWDAKYVNQPVSSFNNMNITLNGIFVGSEPALIPYAVATSPVTVQLRVPENLDAVDTKGELSSFRVANLSCNSALLEIWLQRKNMFAFTQAIVRNSDGQVDILRHSQDTISNARPGDSLYFIVEGENIYSNESKVSLNITPLLSGGKLINAKHIDSLLINPESLGETNFTVDVTKNALEDAYNFSLIMYGSDIYGAHHGYTLENITLVVKRVFNDTVTLLPGWNQVVFRILPINHSILNVLNSIEGLYAQVKTQEQDGSIRIWEAGIDEGWNDLHDLGFGRAYMIKMLALRQLNITGYPDPSVPFYLRNRTYPPIQVGNCSREDKALAIRNVTYSDYNRIAPDYNNTEYVNVSCDYCTPYWIESQGLCNGNNSINVSYIDSHYCFFITHLPSDALTPPSSTYSCNHFCTNYVGCDIVPQISCVYNYDCDDNNINTRDICLSKNTSKSSCYHAESSILAGYDTCTFPANDDCSTQASYTSVYSQWTNGTCSDGAISQCNYIFNNSNYSVCTQNIVSNMVETLNNGLMYYFPLNSTNLSDVISGKTLIYEGNPTNSLGIHPQGVSNVYITGAGSYLYSSAMNKIGLTYSVSAWLNVSDKALSDYGLIYVSTTNDDNDIFLFVVDSTHLRTETYSHPKAKYFLGTQFQFEANKFQHYTLVRNYTGNGDATILTYQDGKLVDKFTANDLTTSVTEDVLFRAGRGYVAQGSFFTPDEIGLWNRALTDVEAKALASNDYYSYYPFSYWKNIGCLPEDVMNQTRNITLTDTRNCGYFKTRTTPEFRSTEYCDYCIPNLRNSTFYPIANLTSCQPNDTWLWNYTATQYDANNCYSITGLPADYSPNTTVYSSRVMSCDYCTPVLVNTSWSAWTNQTCLPGDRMNQSRSLTEYDVNFCNEVTNISFMEYNANSVCDYCTPRMVSDIADTLNDGLIYYFPLSATNLSDVKNGKTLIYEGNPTFSLGINPQGVNNVYITGAGSYLYSSAMNKIGLTYSVSAWLNVTAYAGYRYGILYVYTPSDQNDIYLFYYNETHLYAATYSPILGAYEFGTPFPYTKNTFQHYALTKDYSSGRAVIKIYQNGILVNTFYPNNLPTSVTEAVFFSIGRGHSSQNSYYTPDEVGIWNRTLTETEIRTLASNKTYSFYPFDSWSNFSCLPTDIMNMTRNVFQSDINVCNETENGTVAEYKTGGFCDYCTPLPVNISSAWQNQTTCMNGSQMQNRNITQYDSHFCYQITSLSSDFVQNTTFTENQAVSCTSEMGLSLRSEMSVSKPQTRSEVIEPQTPARLVPVVVPRVDIRPVNNSLNVPVPNIPPQINRAPLFISRPLEPYCCQRFIICLKYCYR